MYKRQLNVLDEERVTADVARAKEMADFVIVCPHWGIEDDNNVCSEQQYWCDLFTVSYTHLRFSWWAMTFLSLILKD